jgi:phage terminase large subunit
LTARIQDRVAKRTAPTGPITMAAALSAALLVMVAEERGHAWPSTEYQDDPVGFSRNVLGVEPWEKQIEILEALKVPNARVSVRAGQKVSKSCTAAVAALWFYCSFPKARVTMTSVTSRQVDTILWRELSIRYDEARVPIGGTLAKLARSGLKSDDFREIVGFTAKEAEAIAGISGENQLYIVDEASGVPEQIFAAIEGNRAGGARILMIANPTRNEGTFYDSHTTKSDFYTTFHISSEDSPNVKAGRQVIKGLALREFVEEKREEWGEESAEYQVRIRGEFPRQEALKVIPLYLVADAEERWEETSGAGRLNIGADPSGEGDDLFGLAARRGAKALEIKALRSTDVCPDTATRDELEDAFVEAVIQFVRKHRLAHEPPPAVKVDTTGGSGNVGGRFAAKLRTKYGTPKHGTAPEVEVFGVDASAKSPDARYPLMRDALWFAVRDWLRGGGALPPDRSSGHDKKLSPELTCPMFGLEIHDRMKVEPKDEIKKRLKRSPDRADALALAVYEPGASRLDAPPPPEPNLDWFAASSRGIDPYASLSETMGGGRRRG